MDKKGGFPKIRESRMNCAEFDLKDWFALFFNIFSGL